MPPMPVRVSRRHAGSLKSLSRDANSDCRPIKSVAGKGIRLEGDLDLGSSDALGLVCRRAQTSEITVDDSSEVSPSRSRLNSPRARRMKVCWSSFEMSSALAYNPASCLEGLRSPDSILRKAPTEQPVRFASSSWVMSRAFRRRLSHSLKTGGGGCSAILSKNCSTFWGIAWENCYPH